MRKYILILFLFLYNNCFGQPPDLAEVSQEATNYKLYYSEKLKTSKWVGFPDSNYVWEGEKLVWEREVIDEEGNPKIIKTWKKPIEIIAKFKPKSKVYGFDNQGKIERATVRKFGGSLKGFIWVDGVSGGGEVTLPFIAPHIFIVEGDRLNPVLTEINTDTSADNWYEIFDGKTHVYVKSFSGIGGAAGSPATLIAHYKMNENTASDNAELVTNWNFANWTNDDPNDWTVLYEAGADPMVNEVGTGEGRGGAGTGSCNIYTTSNLVAMGQIISNLIVGRKYRFYMPISKAGTGGGIAVREIAHIMWPTKYTYTTSKVNFVFVATHTDINLRIQSNNADDTTFDNISIKLCAVEDSSGNDHDGLLQEHTADAHVAGKINGAFDFNGTSDYIEIGDHDDFTPVLTSFSFSGWYKIHEMTSCAIASKGVLDTDGEWIIGTYSDDKIKVSFCDESVNDCYIGRLHNTALTSYENQWLHIVVTYNGGTTSDSVRIYLNGVQSDDADFESNAGSFVAVENLTGHIRVGRYDTYYTDGLIDNTVLFSIELTPDEVKRLYNNRNGTEILQEIDSVIRPRRSNASPLGTRARFEFP